MKKALIVKGGWDGHEPDLIAERFQGILEQNNFSVTVSDKLDSLLNKENLMSMDLLVMCVTMGEITNEQAQAVSEAVGAGCGLAGCHGGMCDAFRNNVLWQFITGGQWVAHPGGDGVEYTVNIKNSSGSLTENINDFKVKSEHYYLHIDPAVEILATTRFPVIPWYHSSNGEVDIPVIWTKRWGFGRVFYNALGHHNDVFDIPEALTLMERGLLWAAEGKEIAIREKLDTSIFDSNLSMY